MNLIPSLNRLDGCVLLQRRKLNYSSLHGYAHMFEFTKTLDTHPAVEVTPSQLDLKSVRLTSGLSAVENSTVVYLDSRVGGGDVSRFDDDDTFSFSNLPWRNPPNPLPRPWKGKQLVGVTVTSVSPSPLGNGDGTRSLTTFAPSKKNIDLISTSKSGDVSVSKSGAVLTSDPKQTKVMSWMSPELSRRNNVSSVNEKVFRDSTVNAVPRRRGKKIRGNRDQSKCQSLKEELSYPNFSSVQMPMPMSPGSFVDEDIVRLGEVSELMDQMSIPFSSFDDSKHLPSGSLYDIESSTQEHLYPSIRVANKFRQSPPRPPQPHSWKQLEIFDTVGSCLPTSFLAKSACSDFNLESDDSFGSTFSSVSNPSRIESHEVAVALEQLLARKQNTLQFLKNARKNV